MLGSFREAGAAQQRAALYITRPISRPKDCEAGCLPAQLDDEQIDRAAQKKV
jgi:hypothetical protein